LIGTPSLTALAFFVHTWYIFYLLVFLEVFFSVMWNIVTVTFRQTIIPTEILGRVNSGYRFFGWGSMPLGSIVGGQLVNILQHHISRALALRIPFLVAGGIGFLTWGIVRTSFTSERLESARLSGGNS
jgi:MFS family permease